MHYNSITVSLPNSITDENESQEDSTWNLEIYIVSVTLWFNLLSYCSIYYAFINYKIHLVAALIHKLQPYMPLSASYLPLTCSLFLIQYTKQFVRCLHSLAILLIDSWHILPSWQLIFYYMLWECNNRLQTQIANWYNYFWFPKLEGLWTKWLKVFQNVQRIKGSYFVFFPILILFKRYVKDKNVLLKKWLL